MIKKDKVISFFLTSAVLGIAISYSNVYLFHIALIILLAYFAFSTLKNNLTIKVPVFPSKLHRLFLWMVIWYTLTIIWSFDKVYSIQYVLYILMGSIISITIIYYSTNIEKLNKVFKTLSIVFFVEIVLSLLEVLTPFRLPISPISNYLPYFGHGNPSSTYLDSMPTGFQWNPNSLTTAMTIIFPFFLLHENKKVKFFGVVSIFILALSAQSRGNVITLCVLLLAFLYILNLRRAVIFGTLIPAIGIVVLLIVSPFLSNSDNQVIKGIYSSFDALEIYLFSSENRIDSLGTRQILIDNGLEKLFESKGIGIGGGASRSYEVNGVSEGMPLHHFWIEILVEGGILFFVLFVYWYLKVLYNLYKASKSSNPKIKYYASSCFLSMFGFIAGAISASSTIYFFPMWLLFGFSITVINIHKNSKIKNIILEQDELVKVAQLEETTR